MRRIRRPTRSSRFKQNHADASSRTNWLSVEKLQSELDKNLNRIREILGESDDLIIRDFYLAGNLNRKAAIIFFDGLTDSQLMDQSILHSLMYEARRLPELAEDGEHSAVELVKSLGLTINEVGMADHLHELLQSIFSGDTALLIDGTEQAILLNTKGWEKRGVEEPSTESVVRGPRDGFSETLRVNTALIRLRLKDPQLRLKNLVVGRRTQTNVALMYIEDIVDPKILQEIEARIKAIDIDAALESGYIEQLIEDHHWSPFPQVQNTERPDKAVANLLEGKVVIITDGTPFVLIAPAVFAQFYQSPEDYYERFVISTLIRFIRILSMGFALLLPSLYIAFTSFHPEMIPTPMAIALAAGRSTVPFPAAIEVFLMEVFVEILREASVRLPGPIGPTIGIVGALVIGQSAVSAGLVSPLLVIVVGLTTIGSFASPSYSASIALRMLRFPMMLAAASFGLLGIMFFMIIIIIHLCSLRSFGVPYMAPFSPSRPPDLKDTFVRAPLYRMVRRPLIMRVRDVLRMPASIKDRKGR